MRRVGILLLACLATWGCSLARSPSEGPWANPPIAQKPRLDLTPLDCQPEGAALSPAGWVVDADHPCPRLQPGTIIFSTPAEATIGDISVAFTDRAWMAFSEWVNRTYTDGIIRWRVLEEANKP